MREIDIDSKRRSIGIRVEYDDISFLLTYHSHSLTRLCDCYSDSPGSSSLRLVADRSVVI